MWLNNLKWFEEIVVLPRWQMELLQECSRKASETEAWSTFEEGTNVSICVAGREDKADYAGRTFIEVFDASDIFGGKAWTWPFGRHDGRNHDVQKLMHSSRWPGLLSCMADILVHIANGDSGRNLQVLVWCKSGRCHSLAAAVWMMKVGRLVNLKCTVYMQRWNEKNSQDKRCDCWNCAKPTGLHCFLLKDAHRLVEMMAKIAAGKDEREDVQADCTRKRIRWMAGSMLRHLRHVEIHCAGRIYDEFGFDPYEEESLLGQHQISGYGDPKGK